MTARVLVACVLSLFASTAWAQWDDEPKRTQTRSSSDSVGAAPTGIMAVIEDDEDEWDEAKTKRSEFDEVKKPAVEKKQERSPSESRPWTDAPSRRGLVVIEEDVSVSNTIIHGVPDPDRIGRSLGASKSEGLSLGATRSRGEKSYRVRADRLDEEEAAEKAKEQAIERKKQKAPMGIVVPLEGDFDDPVNSGDPWARERKTDIHSKGGSSHRSLLDELAGSSSPTFESRSYVAPETSPAGVRESRSASDSVWNAEGGDRVFNSPSERTTFFSADEVKGSEPEAKPVAAPAPARMRKPAAVSPEPEPERVEKKRAGPARRAVGEAQKEPEKILSYDPFAKLEGDLAEAEGRARPEKKSLPEYEIERPKAESLRAPKYEEPEMPVGQISQPKEKGRTRDLSYWGLSALAGVGVNIANAPVSGFTSDFAWGVNLRLQPAFTGPISLDLSYWRATRADGTPVVSVDSAWSHVGIRGFYVRDFDKGLFMGFGGGLLLTDSSVSYIVNDAGEDIASGSELRPGGEVGAIMGFRYKLFEMRLDLRAMLRGGLRVDFLPVISLGVSI